MKKLHIVIIVVLVLIIGYLLLTKQAEAPEAGPESVPVSETLTETNIENDAVTENIAINPSTESENIVVNTDSLGDGQQKLLETFGVEGDIEITPAMIACAEEKIGPDRVAEIVDGATPSFMEGLSLAACY